MIEAPRARTRSRGAWRAVIVAVTVAVIVAVGIAASPIAIAGPAASTKPKAPAAPTPAAAGPRVAPRGAGATAAAATAYRAAMKRGRVATDKQDYAAAVTAFTAALAAVPDDPQALAERGYAHLLAHDDAAAAADLAAAQRHAATAALQGQIWFNLGLVAEGRGDAAAAQHAFAESNRLHPSKAAAARLGAAACDAVVDAAPRPLDAYPSWAAAAAGLARASPAAVVDGAPPRDEAAARAWLCKDDGCDGDGPWVVTVGDREVAAEMHVLFAQKGGGLYALAGVGEAQGGRCAWGDAIDVDDAVAGAPVRITVTREPQDVVWVKDGGDGTCDDLAAGCVEACEATDKSTTDLFVDPARGTLLARIDRPWSVKDKRLALLDENFAQRVTLAVGADGGVVLAGGGCDRTVPLGAAKAPAPAAKPPAARPPAAGPPASAAPPAR